MRYFKEVFSFLLTFGIIFSVFFVLMNFSAVSSSVEYYVLGVRNAEMIESIVGEVDYDYALLETKGAKKIIEKEFPPLQMSVTPLDFRLVIPKIGRNVPLVKMSDKYITDDLWGKFEKEVQKSLRDGVIHYPGTANPGQVGNAFFTGHSSYYPWDKGEYKEVFANLNQLDKGDEYIIYFQQEKYKYKVTEVKEVRPSDVNVLEQSENKKMSSLMTCWPLGTALKRLVVVAEQV